MGVYITRTYFHDVLMNWLTSSNETWYVASDTLEFMKAWPSIELDLF